MSHPHLKWRKLRWMCALFTSKSAAGTISLSSSSIVCWNALYGSISGGGSWGFLRLEARDVFFGFGVSGRLNLNYPDEWDVFEKKCSTWLFWTIRERNMDWVVLNSWLRAWAEFFFICVLRLNANTNVVFCCCCRVAMFCNSFGANSVSFVYEIYIWNCL